MIDLRPDHLEIVRDLLRQHVPECEVRAFGSRFKWTAKQASDLDLAVVCIKRLPTKKIMRLKEAFEESILPMRVDVLDWHAITPEFQRVIDAGFEVIQGGEVSPLAAASSPSAAGSSATPLDDCDWSSTTIGAVIANGKGEIKTGPFGTKLKASEYTETGVPVISVGEVGFGRFTLRGETPKVDASVTSRMPEYVLHTGDIVFGRKGSVERSSIVRTEQDGWFLGSDGIRLRLPSNVDALFIAYQFQTEAHKSWMIQHAAGSTMPSLNQGTIERIPVVLPPLPFQKVIARILGTLDEKIELCRRTNETLEAMARALFKDWFVDFGPVRAKLEGRDPYLSAELWSLFPDRLVDSELGEIPEGWEYLPVSEIIEFNPTESLKKGSVAPYIDMAALPTVGSNTERPVPREFGSGMKFRNNDTLMARITPCLENGKTAYVQSLPKDTIGWGSTEFIVMRPKAPVPSEYAYILARDSNFRKHAIQSMTGTSGRQRAQATMIADYSVANATPEIWEAFSKAIQPWFTSIGTSAERIESLVSLRDSLLPKLLSGELSIPDALLMVEETVG